jgi:anti-anti-sigma factor
LADSSLKLAQTRSGEVCILALLSRIDSTNANDLLEQLKRLLSAGEKAIVVDFSGVPYLTSAAFRVLLVATSEAGSAATRFALCSLPSQVRELFEMGGLLEEFVIFGSRDEALAKLAECS